MSSSFELQKKTGRENLNQQQLNSADVFPKPAATSKKREIEDERSARIVLVEI